VCFIVNEGLVDCEESHLNLSEGCSRKSEKERIRFLEIARGSLIEVDSAIGIAFKLSYVTFEDLTPPGNIIVKSFKLLSGMIRSSVNNQ
jgi:four helix bundle protein